MEKWLENIRMALNALLSNKFRAVLTTFGIGIGIAAVVVLVSLGQALQGYLGRQFLSVGADLIYVRPVATGNGFGGEAGRGGGLLSSLTDKDVSLLSDPYNLPNVRVVVPLVQVSRPADNGPYEEQVRIYGTTPQYFRYVESSSGRRAALFFSSGLCCSSWSAAGPGLMFPLHRGCCMLGRAHLLWWRL